MRPQRFCPDERNLGGRELLDSIERNHCRKMREISHTGLTAAYHPHLGSSRSGQDSFRTAHHPSVLEVVSRSAPCSPDLSMVRKTRHAVANTVSKR